MKIGSFIELYPWAAVGFILGLSAIWYIEPDKTGGVLVLFVIPCALLTCIGLVVKAFHRPSETADDANADCAGSKNGTKNHSKRDEPTEQPLGKDAKTGSNFSASVNKHQNKPTNGFEPAPDEEAMQDETVPSENLSSNKDQP